MADTTRAPAGFEEAFDGLFRRAFIVGRPSSVAASWATRRPRRTWPPKPWPGLFVHWRKISGQAWREGWVVRVATNLALDIVRKQARMTDAEQAEGMVEYDDVAVRMALVAAMARHPAVAAQSP